MTKPSIVILGFDHPKFDRRIQKDIRFLSKRFSITYIYRGVDETEEGHDHNNYIPLCPDQRALRLFRRFHFEREMVSKALEVDAKYFYLHGMFITLPRYFLSKLRGKAEVVYDAHEFDLEPIYIHNSFFRWMLASFLKLRQKSISKRIDYAFTVSVSIREFMSQHGFKNVQLKPNVSSSNVVSPVKLSDRKKIIVIAGNVSRERGIKEFLGFFKLMLRHDPDIELHMHSDFLDKDFKAELEKWAVENQTEDKIIFAEILSYNNLIEKLSYSLASVMAFPTSGGITNKIALPNRFFDSLAAGTPVLASSHSTDVANIVGKERVGWLLNPDLAEASVKAFLTCLSQPGLYDERLSSIYAYAKRNDLDSIRDKLMTVFS